MKSDLPFFAENALKLRPKAGPLEPFVFNAAQRVLHDKLEQLKATTGVVRVLVLKARQLGISTYVAGRFFHRTIGNPGLRTIIIGHERRASSNLFGIVKRFYEPYRTKRDRRSALAMPRSSCSTNWTAAISSQSPPMKERDAVATAQQLHASEAAFWADLPLQAASLMQTVPDIPGTEIIIESTANGYNDFHTMWRKAEAGESEFVPVFLPWSIEPGYRRPVTPDFTMDGEEKKLAELYGLDAEQINWRRAKISQLGSADYFLPGISFDAVRSVHIVVSFDSFIPASLVIKARKEKVEAYGPLIIGVDPAGMGADRTSVAWRKGRCILKVESRRNVDTMETCRLGAENHS